MATYKVIQDIEAEDHILGPLSLRQFIFAMIAIFLFYICFIVATKSTPILLIIFLPPALFFGFFALPFGRDQPTEVWALAKIRFWFKPRKRIWNQDGIKELVTITVPKKIERVFSDGLSQVEVQSRLKALANTIDSRGWVVKNVDAQSYASPLAVVGTDRLIDIDNAPQEVPAYDVTAVKDMLDETTNPIAQQFDSMMSQSQQTRRQDLVNQLNDQSPAPSAGQPEPAGQVNNPPADYWFMGQAGGQDAASTPTHVPAPAPADETTDEKALAAKLKAQSSGHPEAYRHLRTLQPFDNKPVAPPMPPPPPVPSSGVTAPSDPAILSLANNDDLNVATLQREAKRAKGEDDSQNGNDEVVVSLR